MFCRGGLQRPAGAGNAPLQQRAFTPQPLRLLDVELVSGAVLHPLLLIQVRFIERVGGCYATNCVNALNAFHFPHDWAGGLLGIKQEPRTAFSVWSINFRFYFSDHLATVDQFPRRSFEM